MDEVVLSAGQRSSLFAEDGVIRLWWDDGQVAVEIEARGLSPADVIEFAGSLEKR